MRPISLFAAGAAASMGLHLLFFGVVAPRLVPSSYAACQPQAVYVGAVLTRSDLGILGVSVRTTAEGAPAGPMPEVAAPGIHVKEPQAPLKPLPALTSWSGASADGSAAPARRPPAPGGQGHLRFYLFEPPAVLRNVDFSDLRKMVEREDVAGQMEVAVTVGSDGSVRTVRRIVGSGHPILDSFILFKLQRAVFRAERLNTQRPVRLYIRLK